MPVQLIRDEFNIDAHNAVVIKTAADVLPVMRQIDQHLKAKAENLLRVRLGNQALWQRFRHYEGYHGVLPTLELIPRVILAQNWNTVIPDWLGNALIVRLGLLEKPFIAGNNTEQFANSVLQTCLPELPSITIENFIEIVSRQGMTLHVLLEVAPLNEAFCRYLISNLGFEPKAAQWFVREFLNAQNPSTFFNNLAYQQHLEHLRGFISAHQLNMALPPKTSDASLLQAFPELPLPEHQANGLADKYLLALAAIDRKIQTREIPSDVIANWLIDWPSLLDAIEERVASQRDWLTPALLAKLQAFRSEKAQALSLALQKLLDGYPLLNASATVNEAIQWSEGYFDYCRQAFLDNHPLDEAINSSFTDWLLAAQSARVPRSNHDWRQFSAKVKRYLQQGYVAVIVMVDALSALNQDKVLQVLQGMDNLVLNQERLFAPLPTLTEVGKMAVLTGLPVNQQPSGNQEAVLRQVYQAYLPTPDALKVLKSWEESNERLERIEDATQLLVYFENRLDDRLHDCPSFSKHRDDIQPIMHQIKRMLNGWQKDAGLLNKDIIFFITADHGMTVTQSLYQGQAITECKDRAVKLKGATSLPDDFVLLDEYAVPKQRYRLTPNGLLAHGGLTPEEVLIPCITLASRPPQAGSTPIEIKLRDNHCERVADRHWQLEIQLVADDRNLTAIEISLVSPFTGKGNVDSLRANKTQNLTLRFSSTQEQEGFTEIEFLLSYHYAGVHEQDHKHLTVKFPASLLEKDAGSQSFEDMF